MNRAAANLFESIGQPGLARMCLAVDVVEQMPTATIPSEAPAEPEKFQLHFFYNGDVFAAIYWSPASRQWEDLMSEPNNE